MYNVSSASHLELILIRYRLLFYDFHMYLSHFSLAFSMGRGLLAGASAVGLGALCYYGLGLSNQAGAIDRAAYVLLDYY